jgi:tetratricopeptide (TPR) repeat protein
MRYVTSILLLSIMSSALAADGDFKAEMQKAAAKIEAVFPASSAKMDGGDFSGANAMLIAAFPNADESAAQSFMLGNVLFDIDRKQSYAFHKTAARLAPDNSNVFWEWALEQHRAGEYAGALASYQIVSKADPNTAETYALQADCLLRLNRIDDAVAAWRKSEDAPNGSIEAMEDIVCTVHREPAPHERRAALLAKATQQRDAKAAGDVIALDCEFPRDWWKAPPAKAYLAHDVPAVLAALNLPADDVLSRAIVCAQECVLADQTNAAAIKAILTKHRLLIYADHTIPTHSELLSVILASAARAKAIDDATLRQQIGPKILKLAKAGKDVQHWNNAAFTSPRGPLDERIKLEREGWQATGDVRFAAGLLALKQQSGQLKGDDPDLAAARKQFPDSSLVQRLAYEVAAHEKKVTRALLADAARAEFTHFSSFLAPATVVNRPRSDYLRAYLAQMLRMPAAEKPAAPEK